MNRKAQLTIIGLIFVIILIIIISNLMPTIVSQIEIGKNTTGLSTSTQALMDLIPLMFVLGIIITFFVYVMPYRPNG
jgi:ABC-type antimicrobial peptide transport system permease subunit